MPKFREPGTIIYKGKEYRATTNGEDGDSVPMNKDEIEHHAVWANVAWWNPDVKELTDEERANLSGMHADGSPLPVHPTVGIPAPLADHSPKSKTIAGEPMPAAGGESNEAIVAAAAAKP